MQIPPWEPTRFRLLPTISIMADSESFSTKKHMGIASERQEIQGIKVIL